MDESAVLAVVNSNVGVAVVIVGAMVFGVWSLRTMALAGLRRD